MLAEVMDGLTACRTIRSLERNHRLPNVPVVTVTANAMEHDKRLCFDAGMSHLPFKTVQQETINSYTEESPS